MKYQDFWYKTKEKLTRFINMLDSVNKIAEFIGWFAPLLPKITKWFKIACWAILTFIGGCSGGGC